MKRWFTIVTLSGLCIFLFCLFLNSEAQLNTVKAKFNSSQEALSSTEADLKSKKVELESTKTELTLTEGELDYAKTELTATNTKLHTTETELSSTKEGLRSAETALASTQNSLTATQAELDITRNELADREIELTDLQISYYGLITGHGYTIKDPTYSEMMRFLRDDDTDKAEYTVGEYECRHFSTELCNHAEEEGIRCSYVTVKFPDRNGHAIVAFNTIDKGLIYIEPQLDDLVKIEIGKYFYKCVVPKAGYYYKQPAYDDTIEEVLIAW